MFISSTSRHRRAWALIPLTAALVAVPGVAATTAASASVQQAAAASVTVRHDVTFMSMLLPHHVTAVRMAQIARQRAVLPEVRRLAARIVVAQTREIRQIQNWLERRGARPMEEPRAIQEMNEQDLEMLRTVDRAEFDHMFLMMMRAHHAAGVMMAIDELENGKDREALRLAETVRDTQLREIEEMNRLLASLNG